MRFGTLSPLRRATKIRFGTLSPLRRTTKIRFGTLNQREYSGTKRVLVTMTATVFSETITKNKKTSIML